MKLYDERRYMLSCVLRPKWRTLVRCARNSIVLAQVNCSYLESYKPDTLPQLIQHSSSKHITTYNFVAVCFIDPAILQDHRAVDQRVEKVNSCVGIIPL